MVCFLNNCNSVSLFRNVLTAESEFTGKSYAALLKKCSKENSVVKFTPATSKKMDSSIKRSFIQKNSRWVRRQRLSCVFKSIMTWKNVDIFLS